MGLVASAENLSSSQNDTPDEKFPAYAVFKEFDEKDGGDVSIYDIILTPYAAVGSVIEKIAHSRRISSVIAVKRKIAVLIHKSAVKLAVAYTAKFCRGKINCAQKRDIRQFYLIILGRVFICVRSFRNIVKRDFAKVAAPRQNNAVILAEPGLRTSFTRHIIFVCA